MPQKITTISTSIDEREFIDEQCARNGTTIGEELLNAYAKVHTEFPRNKRKRGAQPRNKNWRGHPGMLGKYDDPMRGWSDEEYARLNADVERRTHFVAWIDDGGIQVEQREQRLGEMSVLAVRPESGGSHPANDVYVILLTCEHVWFPMLRDEAVKLAVQKLRESDETTS